MRGIICLLLLGIFHTALAQENQGYPTINAWLEFGTYRISPVEYDKSAGVDIALKCQVNRVMSTLQYLDCFDSEESHGVFELFTNDNHYHAGNILLGITNRQCKFGHVSVSSGLGVFWGEFGGKNVERFATIGWPVEAAASINLFPFVGINIKAFTNVNSRHSFVGFGMDIQVGKMRDIGLREIGFRAVPGM
jgi:hypothetical protein